MPEAKTPIKQSTGYTPEIEIEKVKSRVTTHDDLQRENSFGLIRRHSSRGTRAATESRSHREDWSFLDKFERECGS
jgi:hypothetical protein